MVTVTGELDVLTARKLMPQLDDIVRRHQGDAVIDLSQAEFIDSFGLTRPPQHSAPAGPARAKPDRDLRGRPGAPGNRVRAADRAARGRAEPRRVPPAPRERLSRRVAGRNRRVSRRSNPREAAGAAPSPDAEPEAVRNRIRNRIGIGGHQLVLLSASAAITIVRCSSKSTPSSSAPAAELLAVHRGREARLLELLLDRLRRHPLQPLRPHVGAGQDEARQLVDREQRLLHRRVARHAQEVGVRRDCTHELGRITARLELSERVARMAVLEVRDSARSRGRGAARSAPTARRRRRTAARRRASPPRQPACGGAASRTKSIHKGGPRPRLAKSEPAWPLP